MADHIKDYWENQGNTHGASHWASWGDNWMIDLEVQTISQYISDNDTVLDIGCANGYSTFQQAMRHSLKSITGVDFASSMVSAARAELDGKSVNCEMRFSEADIRSLAFPDNSFDVVYTTRVVINLPTWEEQKQAIQECLRVVRKGGTVVLSEGFWEPLVLLNALRALVKLPTLKEHDFNRYLKLEYLREFLDGLKLSYEINDFSSVYYLGSRFVRELVTDPSAYPGFTNPINKIFYEIEQQFSGGGMGIQQAVVIRP